MTRLLMRLSVVALVGMVSFGLGSGGEGQAACMAGPGLAALLQRTLQGVGGLLSPASAEAAVVKKAAKKSVKQSAKQKSAKQKPAKLTATAQKKKRAKAPLPKTKGSKVMAAKKGKSKPVVASLGKNKRTKRSAGGRCEPQSLTYARQRSGIMRSRNGRENGPLTWFSSEKQLGMTTDQPQPGSVLILGSDKGHGMSTGHVAYVEEAYAESPSRYKIVFSHTNYDRRCSMETNIEALYDSSAKTLDIYSGAWQPWGRGLRVAGFIRQE